MQRKNQLREPVQTGIGPAADRWFNRVFIGDSEGEAVIVERVVNPLKETVLDYIMPYVYIGLLMYLFLVLLLIVLLYFVNKNRVMVCSRYYPIARRE